MNQSERIDELISGFLRRDLSEPELQEFEQWLGEHPENRGHFKDVYEDYQRSHILNLFTPEKMDRTWELFSQKIREEKVIRMPKRKSAGLYPYWRVAASIMLLLVFSFVLVRITETQPGYTEHIVVNNAKNRNTFVLLPDSSSVWLNANSTIEYDRDFGTKHRNITLRGEAFFDVRRKQDHDFVLNTDQLKVHVTGTRFNVRAYKGEEARTTLEEGKVELSLTRSKKSYSMVAGDQIVVSKELDTVTIRKVNPTHFTAWKEEQLVFDNTPLAEIVIKLENRYKVEISVDMEIGKRERFTMTVSDQSIEEVLEMIQLSSNLKWEKRNRKITIYESTIN